MSLTEDGYLLPWSGNSFGLLDLSFVAGRSRPIVIGVVGPHNAGKTTMLSTIYLLLLRGHRFGDWSFAGSYTLGGWENLADPLRWKADHGPAFPPHTTSNAGRAPGLLHLALRTDEDQLTDVFFTDAPGEWFERWAVDRNAPEADGARWIARYADAFLLFADCEALAGPARGAARSKLRDLTHRISSEANRRPVGVVWAKSDIAIAETIRSTLKQMFADLFPGHREFQLSVHRGTSHDGAGFSALFDTVHWLIDPGPASQDSALTIPCLRQGDVLLAFRGR